MSVFYLHKENSWAEHWYELNLYNLNAVKEIILKTEMHGFMELLGDFNLVLEYLPN